MVKDIFSKKILKTFGAVALCILKFVVLLFLSSMLFGSIASMIGEVGYKLPPLLNQLISTDAMYIGVIILGYVYYSMNEENMLVDCEIKKTTWSAVIKAFILGFCMVAISSVLTSGLIYIFHLHSDTYNHVEQVYSLFDNSWLAISPIILAPILEEILCRGMLFHRLQKIVNFKIAIVIQAIFFAILHGNIIQFGYTFLMGIIAGYLVYYTKSLIPSIVFHFSNNLIGLMAVDMLSSNKIIENTYIILAPIVCLYLLWNIRKSSKLKIA